MRTITTKRMKYFAAICLSLIVVLSTYAQTGVPQKMSYQAVVRDGINSLLVNKTVGIRISVLQNSATGSVVYKETHSPMTNDNGLVSIAIGDGNVQSGAMATIDWSKGPFFVKTEIDPAGGSSYSITSTTQLLTVPFALYAEKIGNGFDGSYEKLTEKPVFADVATSGEYEDIQGKPVLAEVATSGSYTKLQDLPTFAEVAKNGSYKSLKDTLTFAKVATSGSYSDLLNVPQKLEKVSELENDSKYLTEEKQQLKLEGRNLSITNNVGNTVNTVILPENTTGGGVTDYEQLTNKPVGTNNGDILYWNSAEKKWNCLEMGFEGQFLAIANGKLAWTEPSFANTSASTYKVGDIYYDMINRKPAGVVFEVSSVGRYSKIMALEDIESVWATKGESPASSLILALDEADGRNNFSVIKSRTDWETVYPGIKSVSALGDKWYIPARGELKAIWNNKESINKQLQEASGTVLKDSFYWSSTEANFLMEETYKYAWGGAMGEYKVTIADSMVLISSGTIYEEDKTISHLIRPIRRLSWEETISKPVDQLYRIGDVYNDDKNTPMGIVISTTTGGLHGTVISLDETDLVWFSGKEAQADLAMGTESGYLNSSNCGIEKESYEVIKWCLAKNGEKLLTELGSWFLPSPEELRTISSSFEFLNEKISKIEGAAKLVDSNYWTSKASVDAAKAYSISMKTGVSDMEVKSSSRKVRAIYQF